ncbi:hypothetical protein [Burkholderia vietnamiensis]|uniref:hypothetical protein n=1 Tax=Burkholderia vietnamiensis TaxID=60552 RepID=UPI00264F0543|nr:hypothetical protein [Burkholderia vietnamiensis]MDN8037038.1 hypothetical protein [Burkholderia vietnamiensis]
MLLAPSIIRTLRYPREHTIERISPAAYAKLADAIHRALLKQGDVMCKALFQMLDAYLAVTGRRLSFANNRFSSIDILVGFVGALYSEKFLHANLDTRYKWAYGWRAALAIACPNAFLRIEAPSTTIVTASLTAAAEEFETIKLRRDQVDLWRGWPVPKSNGLIAWPDLRKLYLRYGKEFADSFAASLGGWTGGRKINGLSVETVFINFIADQPSDWQMKNFGSHNKVSYLMVQFLIHLTGLYGQEGNQYSTLASDWNRFVNFATSFLCSGEFFARLSKEDFPALPSKQTGHPGTHRRTDGNGVTYITKLLTDVPLHLSHEEAADLIYFKIQEHLDLVERWAQSEVNALWSRFQRRQKLAEVGRVKKVLSSHVFDGRTSLIDRQNPAWKAHACATFAFHGFKMRSDGSNRTLYPHPLGNLAQDVLALPVAGALLPHLTLLVIDHPQLTPSFFENLRLFDNANQLSGVTETDEGWMLDGDKFRRGPENSEQKIQLSERSIGIVAQVVHLTQPLRDYLKAKADPNWRYLFLHCGKGFSNPSRIRISHDTSRFRSVGSLKQQFLVSGQMSEANAVTLAARFSLVAVRATTAVVAYIREPDIQKLARLLGHKELDVRLLERYLPAPLLVYFEERWVRLFQCGILVEALKGSKYLLPSIGFQSLEELNKFISHHALKWAVRPRAIEQEDPAHLFASVVFAVDEEILTLLLAVQAAVASAKQPVSKLAIMWDEYAGKLFEYIEHSSPPRNDFRTMLKAARRRDCSGMVSLEAIYA